MLFRPVLRLSLLACSTVFLLAAQSPPGDEPIRLVGLFKVQPGQEATFENLVDRAVARTKSEDRGWLRYDFFKVAPRRSKSRTTPRTTDYVLIEEWEDRASLTAHLQWASQVIEEMRAITSNMEFLRLSPQLAAE